jgi:hypothetical protein
MITFHDRLFTCLFLPLEQYGTGLGAVRRAGREAGPVAGGGGTAAGAGSMMKDQISDLYAL